MIRCRSLNVFGDDEVVVVRTVTEPVCVCVCLGPRSWSHLCISLNGLDWISTEGRCEDSTLVLNTVAGPHNHSLTKFRTLLCSSCSCNLCSSHDAHFMAQEQNCHPSLLISQKQMVKQVAQLLVSIGGGRRWDRVCDIQICAAAGLALLFILRSVCVCLRVVCSSIAIRSKVK